MRFSKDNQPVNRGRPKGSRNKNATGVDATTKKEALRQLQKAVKNGEPWAILAVMDIKT